MSTAEMTSVTLDADDWPRGINLEMRRLAQEGVGEIVVTNPRSRHNLGVGQTDPRVTIRFRGSTGYYCGGLNAGTDIVVEHNTGWGVGEAMSAGTIDIHGNSVIGTGASMRGGTLIIRGSAGPRTGAGMKGGTLIIEGNAGYSTGFMAHAGHIIVLGNAGESLADSLWLGNIYVAGEIRSLGNDAIVVEPDEAQDAEVHALLRGAGIDGRFTFKKVQAEQKLWYFDNRNPDAWLKI